MVWEFIATHIWQLLGIGGGLGVVGILVLLFVVGVPGAVLIGHALGLVREIIKFLQTPLGQLCGWIALCLVAFWVGDIHGTRVEKAAWVASDLKAQADKAALEKKIAEDTAKDATAKLEQLTQQDFDLQKKVADYEKTPNRYPDTVCIVGANAARLRDVAGQSETADEHSRRLRTPGKARSAPAR